MEIFNNRVRILLEVDGQNKSFYWFECKGNDIYWGYSGKASKSLTTDFSGLTATINLETCNEETFQSAKSSFHESGEFHIKMINDNGESKYATVMNWRKKDEIHEPFRIMALFTKAPINYDDYNRSPTRKGSKSLIVKFKDNSKNLRQYVEFYICPEGKFLTPEPMIAVSEKVTDKPFTYSLSNKYILAVRMLSFPEAHEFNTWHPDKELCFYTEDSSKA